MRSNLDGWELVRPLVTRIRKRNGVSASRRWARRIQRQIPQYESVPPQARELTYLLRVMTLERAIEGVLVRGAASATEAQKRRARRWLLRSEAILAAVADKGWREFLRKRKTLLESKAPGAQRVPA